MISANVYLNFDGDTREAMSFYAQTFGGQLNLKLFSDGPPEISEQLSPELRDRILHAHLSVGDTVIMASDSMPGVPLHRGNNYWINVMSDQRGEVDRWFAALSEGGHTLMPLQVMFWGSYFGMCTDRFGTNWMLQVLAKEQ